MRGEPIERFYTEAAVRIGDVQLAVVSGCIVVAESQIVLALTASVGVAAEKPTEYVACVGNTVGGTDRAMPSNGMSRKIAYALRSVRCDDNDAPAAPRQQARCLLPEAQSCHGECARRYALLVMKSTG